jgi:hypothetical protein
MIGTSVCWESVYNISHSWAEVLICTSCIWSDAIPRWIRQKNSNKFCANFGKSETEPLASVRGRKHEPYRESPNSQRPKDGETCEGQSQEHAHYILWHPGKPNSQFRILTVTFYGNRVKMCEDFSANFGDKKNWLLHHDNAPSHIFTREFFFLQKTRWLPLPTHPYFSLFPQLKIKVKGRHFDTIEVMEAEYYDFQDAFTKWQKRWERKGTTSRTSKLKVSFWSNGSTNPGNYGWLVVDRPIDVISFL